MTSVLALVFLGCASVPESTLQSERRINDLERRLTALDPNIDSTEARKLATTAVQESASLTRQYEVVRPPWVHNVLVNNGVKQWGLCYEWTNDLYESLYRLQLQTLDLHLAVARMDTRREHNAILVTPRGAPFETGLILDAWRHSGRLWFGPAATDKYPWVPLPEDRVNPKLQELLDNSPNFYIN